MSSMVIDNGEIEVIEVSVGKEFTLYQERSLELLDKDGAYFEASEFNQGYHFCVHFRGINFMELNNFRNGKVSVRLLQKDKALVMPMIKFGKDMIFEMVFDPTIYGDDRALQMIDKNNILTMFLIEGKTNLLKAIRQCNLPLKMIQACKTAWSRAMLDPNFSNRYVLWQDELKQYTLEQLWSKASSMGELGETYDLSEINIPNNY